MTTRPGHEDHADVVEVGAERPRGRRRRVQAVAVMAALAAVATAGAPSVVAAARHGSGAATGQATAFGVGRAAAAAPAAPVCPASGSTFPLPDGSGGYAVQIKADITDVTLLNGWNEIGQNWTSTTSKVSAKACGLLQVPSLQVSIAKEGLVFDTSKAEIATLFGKLVLFPVGTFAVKLTTSGPSSTTVIGVNPDPDGRLQLAASTPVFADVGPGPLVPGVTYSCRTAVATSLTTGTSRVVPTGRPDDGGLAGSQGPWTLAGSPLAGPLVGATAKVVGNDFEIPVFSPDPPCDVFQYATFNGIFGGLSAAGNNYWTQGDTLPFPRGASQVTGTLTITDVDQAALQAGPPAFVPGT